MDLNQLIRDIHQNAVEHGWWNTERDPTEIIALIHSELSEALEEARNSKPMMYVINEQGEVLENLHFFHDRKPEGIAVELADAVIRIFDYFGELEIDKVSDDIYADGSLEATIESVKKEMAETFQVRIAAFTSLEHWNFSEAFEGVCADDMKTTLKYLTMVVACADGWLERRHINLWDVVKIKHAYNKTRPYMHGGKAF